MGVASETSRATVAIVGAGPAGTAAAAHLGQLGVRDVVLLDRHDFPRDKTCGSGVSPKGIEVLRELGVWDEIEPHAYRIKGIRIVTPSGHESWQSAGDALEAVVCQRRTLDHILLQRAQRRGVRFVPHFSASKLLTEGDRTVGVMASDGRKIMADVVLVAGGTHCRLDGVQRPRRLLQAIMGWWDHLPMRPGYLEMIFDRMLGPGYGWVFPESDTRANIGIVYEDGTTRQSEGGKAEGEKENARALFTRFLDKHLRGRLEKATQVGGWKGHPIAWSYRIEQLTAPGRITIGESALLTHPATAEGIYQGMRSGMIAAEALADLSRGTIDEATARARYEREVKRAFQLSFAVGGAVFRRMVRGQGLDVLVKTTGNPVVQSATAKLMAMI